MKTVSALKPLRFASKPTRYATTAESITTGRYAACLQKLELFRHLMDGWNYQTGLAIAPHSIYLAKQLLREIARRPFTRFNVFPTNVGGVFIRALTDTDEAEIRISGTDFELIHERNGNEVFEKEKGTLSDAIALIGRVSKSLTCTSVPYIPNTSTSKRASLWGMLSKHQATAVYRSSANDASWIRVQPYAAISSASMQRLPTSPQFSGGSIATVFRQTLLCTLKTATQATTATAT